MYFTRESWKKTNLARKHDNEQKQKQEEDEGEKRSSLNKWDDPVDGKRTPLELQKQKIVK